MYSWRFYRKFHCCRREFAEQSCEENAIILPSAGKMSCLIEERRMRDQVFPLSFIVAATLSNT